MLIIPLFPWNGIKILHYIEEKNSKKFFEKN